MSLLLPPGAQTETAPSTTEVNIALSILPPTPAHTRPASADPAHDAEPATGDIFLRTKSKKLYPAIRARLEEHSPDLAQMIKDIPLGGALDVPEDDWVVEELRRWTNCTGMALPTDLEAQPLLSPNKQRERLATLLRVAHTYEVSPAMATLHKQLVESFPITACILDVQYGLPDVARFAARTTLATDSFLPRDPVEQKLWDALSNEQRDRLLQLAMHSERPLDEAATEDPSYS